MAFQPAEVYPALVTNAVLDAYTQYRLSQSADATASGDAALQRKKQSNSREVPQSLQEALAPLELLYGKTALSAIGIALHGTELVIRYVEELPTTAADDDHDDDYDANNNDSNERTDDEVTDDEEGVRHTLQPPPTYNEEHIARGLSRGISHADEGATKEERCVANSVSQTTTLYQRDAQGGRWLYHVGEHTLFSPYYCPCSAYAYQSIQRQEVWCCKHLLALQLALRVEAAGLPHDNFRVRVVPSAEFTQLLLNAL
jgi:predicted nucleic acid-binding Zn finger protein